MAVDAGSDVSQRVMRAAKQLFFAKGFAGTPLRAIANEAGTSESGVLRLYHSKNGLLRAVYASCYAEINDHVDAAVAAAAEMNPDPASPPPRGHARGPRWISRRPENEQFPAEPLRFSREHRSQPR